MALTAARATTLSDLASSQSTRTLPVLFKLAGPGDQLTSISAFHAGCWCHWWTAPASTSLPFGFGESLLSRLAACDYNAMRSRL